VLDLPNYLRQKPFGHIGGFPEAAFVECPFVHVAATTAALEVFVVVAFICGVLLTAVDDLLTGGD